MRQDIAAAMARLWAWGKRHLLRALVVALAVFLSAFLAVIPFAEPSWSQILEYLGIAMGGVLLAIGAVIANRRAVAMENAAQAQVEANKGAEAGRRQERLKTAIEHLGHQSDSVRLGGAYELFHLVKEKGNEDLRQTALDILCAHIRWTTGEADYRDKHKDKPSTEVQSLLTLLFVQKHKVFRRCHIDLQRSWLNGAHLFPARLQGADLSGAHLQGADLSDAHLQEADLSDAHLQGAQLQEAGLFDAHLQGADLFDARLQGADLSDARLQGACLSGARLQEADLSDAYLQDADLSGAHLQGADLSDAHLQEADLSDAHLQGAVLSAVQLRGANLSGTQLQGVTSKSRGKLKFRACIRAGIDRESDLSGVIFEEDGLPKDSGAITGAYTAEDAERWIAEYEQAMGWRPPAGEE